MIEEKIARICWNTNHWVYPSGREGKSINKESYEFITGFGHEEWNFDTENLIDGYIYGFLEQFNTKNPVHVGKNYKIYLYSIQKVKSNENKKWWLGRINQVEVVSKEESKKIYKIYKDKGWYSKMEADLKNLNIDPNGFLETPSDIFINIRFKIKDMILLDSPVELKKNDPAIPSFYYNLLNYKQPPVLPSYEDVQFGFKPGHNPGKHKALTKRLAAIEGKKLLHNEIQTNIFEILEKMHGKGKVGSENSIGYQSKVDLVVHTDTGFTFYEIKISPTAKAAIRDAFGQLLEYAYWPNKLYAKKLIIISPQPSTQQTSAYLSHVREKFNIPIYYQQYDLEKNVLKNII